MTPRVSGITDRSGRRAVTLVELLVALTVTVVFIGSVSAAFIQIIRASDEAQAQIRASVSARSAVDLIARDLRALELDSTAAYRQLLLTDRSLIYGDNISNDGDGSADEEILDGFDGDGDWNAARDDRHQDVGGRQERPGFVGVPDLGDDRVDEDCRFSQDEISFFQPAGTNGPGSARRRVTYRLGSFDGQDNVLLRATVEDPGVAGPYTETIEPVAFEVVSLDILAWNANSDSVAPGPSRPVTGVPYWTSFWDARVKNFPTIRPANAPFGVPPFKFPAAFYIRVTVNAERRPLSEIADWPLPVGRAPLKTVSLNTVVTCESVISDTRYFLYVRED